MNKGRHKGRIGLGYVKCISVFVFMLFVVLETIAQTPIKINVKKAQLNQVLSELKDQYNFQFVFDSDLLSNYSVSINRTFSSQDEALQFLIKQHPLEIEKSGNVFIIVPKKEKRNILVKTPTTQISGQVLESQSYEPLPFSYISINNKYVQADQQGHFSFLASADSTFDIKISHLGYYIYDTIITQSVNRKYLLIPRIEEIKEVRVESSPVELSTLIGDRSGKMKISHRIAPILPGHGDNSVFNLLRLMPGILAAGEQSTDLLIWGGYESHSKIMFDGFTLFGLKNFNDNISVVNPFLVKNIELKRRFLQCSIYTCNINNSSYPATVTCFISSFIYLDIFY